jgi:hypothetical protein
MKSLIKFCIAVAMVFSFVSCGVSMADTTAEKINGAPDGYKGGKCLQPGDECINDLVCGLTVDGEKICTEPVVVVTDDSEETADEDIVLEIPELSASDCEGLELEFSEVPSKVVFFGAKGDEDTKTVFKLSYKYIKAYDYVKYACSGIGYDAKGSVLKPLKCHGMQGNSAVECGSCNGGENSTTPVCAWDCDPFRCAPL